VVRQASTSAPPSTLFSLIGGPPSLFSDGCGTGFAGSVFELPSRSAAFHNILFVVDIAFGLVVGYNLDLRDSALWSQSCSAAFQSVSPIYRWVGGQCCVAPSSPSRFRSSAATSSFVSPDRRPSFGFGGFVLMLFRCSAISFPCPPSFFVWIRARVLVVVVSVVVSAPLCLVCATVEAVVVCVFGFGGFGCFCVFQICVFRICPLLS